MLMRYFRLYLVVGGMPAAVDEYVHSHDLSKLVNIQRRILVEYRRDISQYDASHALYIREVFDQIPSELNKCNKRFTFGAVLKEGRFSVLEDGFLWLKEAGVAIPAYCVEEPKPPLELSRKRNLFKLFANDVGLLAAMYMNGIQLRILNAECTLNIGAIYENVVAQELKAHGFAPNYYNSKKHGELDFVIENDGHACPIEVKSGKDYHRHNALSNLLQNPNFPIQEAFVLCNDNLVYDGKVIYLPIYMTMCLKPKELPEHFIYQIDTASRN